MGSATRLRTMHAVADLEYSVEADVATITINRPDARNAMSSEVITGLHDVDRARTIRRRACASSCSPERATERSALGPTSRAWQEAVPSKRTTVEGLLADVFRDLWSLGKPTIARVRGYALAGGFGLAMACDFVIASRRRAVRDAGDQRRSVALHDHRPAASIDAAASRARAHGHGSALAGRGGRAAGHREPGRRRRRAR